jgi:metal-responsive CopG/Arc/MetJ family transcriptional regulator
VSAENVATVRASISFPANIYRTLEDIAIHRKVSLAWVVRDAAERYVKGEGGRRANSAQRRARQITG